MGTERSSEGVEQTGLPPNPVGKHGPEMADQQTYQLCLQKLRRELGLPEGDFKDLDSIITWVVKKCDQANENRPAALMAEKFLPEPIVTGYHNLVEAIFRFKDTAPFEIPSIEAAIKKVQEMHATIAELREFAEGSLNEKGDFYTQDLKNLLAVIHRDGGHYTEKHGIKKSVEDAMLMVSTFLVKESESSVPAPYLAPVTKEQYLAGPNGMEGRNEARETPTIQGFVGRLLADSDLNAPAAWDILRVCLELAVFLIAKNSAYGNSALEPVRILSSADPAEQLRVRMDDKLSRLIRGQAGGEDTLKDIVGYWVLMQVAERIHGRYRKG